ncbi:phospholipid-transporting ATPase ABCA3-like isoform X2 [Ornithodoros turicata]|uniref:phospholipid-transporting ATPase ABCA3-like isoform X2 n=1 Tax=Ornithodoros turicata TaxID=34597 RepID=UPI0031394FA7
MDSSSGCGTQTCLLMWKNVYLYRVRRVWLLSLLESAFALLVLIGIWNDAADTTSVVPVPPKQVYKPAHPLDGFTGNISTIYYAPDAAFYRMLCAEVASTLGVPMVMPFQTDQDIDTHLQRKKQKAAPGSIVALIFNSSRRGRGRRQTVMSQTMTRFFYTVRINGLIFDINLDYVRDLVCPGPLNLSAYNETTHLLPVQYAVESAYLKLVAKANGQKLEHNVSLQRFPYPSVYPEQYKVAFVRTVIRFGISFLLPFCMLVVELAREKASGQREMQRLNGVNDLVYWFSHFVSAQSFLLPLEALMEVFLYKVTNSKGQSFLVKADPVLVYLVLVLYGSAAIMHAFFISVFVNSYGAALVVSPLYWILSILVPYLTIENPYGFGHYLISRPKKLISSFVPGMCLHWCWIVIERFERFSEGANWTNFYDRSATPDNVTLLELLLVSLLSCLLLMFLAWYLDNVLPFGVGLHRAPWFLIQWSYWSPPVIQPEQLRNVYHSCKLVPGRMIQTYPRDSAPVLYLVRLTKFVRNKPVLRLVNLRVFDKEITVLLSGRHRAASLMLQIITGYLAPDEGQVIVDHYDVHRNPRDARRCFSFCPEQNVIFAGLTVEEHLLFYGVLSGIDSVLIRFVVSELMDDLNMNAIRSEFQKNLDDSQQRLLCVAIAIITSDSKKLLVLDKPTSKMDPQTRRDVWELLLKIRRFRGIILCTEDVEEADALADRVIFLQGGHISCAGAPSFLRGRIGMGYQLHFQKGAAFNDKLLKHILRRRVRWIQRVSDNANEVTYKITDSEDPSTTMRDIVLDIELRQDELDIVNLGITVRTLEDVILRIRDRGSATSVKTTASPGASSTTETVDLWGRATEPGTLRYLSTLLYKRYLDCKRALRPTRWCLPAVVFLVWGICEYIILDPEQSVQKTLDYKLDELFNDPQGFCEIRGTEGQWKNFTSQVLCRTLWQRGLEEMHLDPTSPSDDLLEISRMSMWRFIFRVQMGTVVENEPGFRVNLWYNGQCPHTPLVLLSLYHTAVLRNLTGDPEVVIQLRNAPVTFAPMQSEQTLAGLFLESEVGRIPRSTGYVIYAIMVRILASLFVPLGACIHAASFADSAVRERVTKSKLLQLMTGLSGLLYWVGNFVFDMGLCTVHSVVFTAAVRSCRTILEDFLYVAAVFAVFMAYSASVVPLAYLASFLFNSASAAFYTLSYVYLCGGVFGATVAAIADLVDIERSSVGMLAVTALRSSPMQWLPTFLLCRALIKLILLRKENLLCMERGEELDSFCNSEEVWRFSNSLHKCCIAIKMGEEPEITLPLSLYGKHTGGYEVVTMLLQGSIYFAIIAFLDSGLMYRFWWVLHRKTSKGPGTQTPTPSRPQTPNTTRMRHCSVAGASFDAGVMEERKVAEIILRGDYAKSKTLILYNMRKTFGICKSRAAVGGVSLTVAKNECFGVLGVAGTGKSTLLRMLAGDLFVTSGEAYMEGLELTKHTRRWQRMVGYCPAEGGLIDTLTGRETLKIYAYLRGIPDVPEAVDALMKFVDLPDPDDLVDTYTPEGRKKLSLAIALQGSPSILLLDIPEVDLVSLGNVHKVVQATRDTRRITILLTCNRLGRFDVLCDRVAIMVAGRLECIGSAKELQAGRDVTINVDAYPDRKNDTAHLREIADAVLEAFPEGCALARSHNGRLEFRLNGESISRSEIFNRMLILRKFFKFQEFYVCDTTLEQIFASYAHKHAGLQE